MYLYSQLADKKMMDVLQKNGFRDISTLGADEVLSQDLYVPYDVRIMAANRYHGEIAHYFTIPGQNFFLTDHLSTQPLMLPGSPPSQVCPASALDHCLLHRHSYFELMYVLSGTVEQYIEGGCYQYGEGTACLMNCNTEHGELFSSDFICVYLCLSRKYLRDHLVRSLPAGSELEVFFRNNIQEQSDFKKDYIRFGPRQSEPAGEPQPPELLLNQILHEKLTGQPGAEHIICGLILRLFSCLQNPNAYTLEYNKLDSSAEAYIFSKVSRLMECKPGGLTRNELAEQLNYNSDYINRVVKKYSGMSVVQYNRSIRLKKAEWMLVFSELPITEIVTQLGYENRTHFYRLFEQKHALTPLEYRQKYAAHAQSGAAP